MGGGGGAGCLAGEHTGVTGVRERGGRRHFDLFERVVGARPARQLYRGRTLLPDEEQHVPRSAEPRRRRGGSQRGGNAADRHAVLLRRRVRRHR